MTNIQTSLELEILKENINHLYKITFVLWILMMQCGFAFLEAGSVRSKNTTNILFKNILDMSVGAIVFWAFGFAFIEGTPGNGFIGHNHFFGSFLVEADPNSTTVQQFDGLTTDQYYPKLIYHFAFAVTSSTIVSGALAERAQFGCYVMYSILISGFIYPVVAHWTWSDYGWLHNGAGTGIRFKDFAGSATVHVVGGTASLIGVFLIKPRTGKYFILEEAGNANQLRGHSVPLTSLGGFILIIGFLAFNAGSIENITDKGAGVELSKIVTNTLLAGSTSSCTATTLNAILSKQYDDKIHWSILNAINGFLAGMVASCAAADVILPWAAVVTGLMAGIAFICWEKLMNRLLLDDPLSAVPVHLGGGLTGSLTAPLFAKRGLLIKNPDLKGVFYSWSIEAFRSFGWNIFGTFCIMIWTTAMCGILFVTLSMVGFLRVTKEQEQNGLDIEYHEIAYPENSLINLRLKTKKKKEEIVETA